MGDLLASHLGSPLAPALRARRVLVLTQSVFFGTLAVCLVIRHGVVTRIDGISYYGVYAPTVPLIVVGYLTAAVGLWRAGGLLVAAGLVPALRPALRVVAAGLVVLLVTPFDRGTFLNWAHMCAGVVMALVQLGIAYTTMTRWASPTSVVAFSALLAGGVIAAVSLPSLWTFPYLLDGQVLFEVGFGWSLFETVRWAASRPLAPSLAR